MRFIHLAFLLVTLGCAALAQAQPRTEAFTVDDINAVRTVSDPRISPDGQWVAYSVASSDLAKDRRVSHLWMTSWDGKQTLQLTHSPEGESSPQWSPDGRLLAFLSARGSKDGPTQLWLLDRRGGEAQVATSFPGDVVDYDWSPDSKRIALIVADEDPDQAATQDADDDEEKTLPPLVIDRFYFKEDETGYLGAQRQHLYVFDVATRKSELLTPGNYDESKPAWSPDGKLIAFASKRSQPDPDRNSQFGLYAIAPEPNSTPRLLTLYEGEVGDSQWASGPVWRPDGKEIAFVAAGDPKLIYYSTHHLYVVSAQGGAARILTRRFDRNLMEPRWSEDGKSIYLLFENDLNQHLSRLDPASGKLEPVLTGRRETLDFDIGPRNRIVVLDSTVDKPEELYAVENGKPRPLTRQNEDWLSTRRLAAVEEISFPSKDGTRISGFIVKPPGYDAARRYPAVLQIHGGPVAQYTNAFMPAWQILAAQGYVVLAANPRGSSGRGEAFATAIYADWGNKDAEDVLAAVDYAVQKGIADPERLGVGGWSYGGILTNFVIAKDSRFKTAVSGASIGNVLAGYGTDMYTREYEQELGTPWKNLDLYLRNSFPFLHADRIQTPTLFLCGDQDFNVPLLNSEQMYQALRSLGVDTQLIIYRGQFHGLDKPSYLRDRMQRFVNWYDKYLRVPPP